MSLYRTRIMHNVSYKNSAAIASVDFPQENQTQQVRKDFRFDTGFRIVFICCCVQAFCLLHFLVNQS